MKPSGRDSWRFARILLASGLSVVVLYLLLLIPDGERLPVKPTERKPFTWNQDAFWSSLEHDFKEARATGCDAFATSIHAFLSRSQQLLDEIALERLEPASPKFDLLETNLFQFAPRIAACEERLADYIQLSMRMRAEVKRQSQRWDMNSIAARERIYRLLYGSRAALEEAMLQAPLTRVPALILNQAEPSQTPSTNFLGVALHSGDILVSRGGAATSALIARGNDYPGNFSHVALVHVDESNRIPSIIEAHIEKGVATASLQEYLADKKLRVMLLRLRADLAPLKADPLLPHKAASLSLHEARQRHIPYDFEMNYRDSKKLFCSEVASAAYQRMGLTLWTGVSHISSPGVASWLAAFGVKHFETQEPSDLEYDPQLVVVAEWRNPETLFNDHADNAVMDAMLEDANRGEALDYRWPLLPPARLAKASSVMLNFFGGVGPIPEGMSASAALRNKRFSQRHAAIKARLIELAFEFKKQNGYTAPYWELVKRARQAKLELEPRP
jgi:hypothetical protein